MDKNYLLQMYNVDEVVLDECFARIEYIKDYMRPTLSAVRDDMFDQETGKRTKTPQHDMRVASSMNTALRKGFLLSMDDIESNNPKCNNNYMKLYFDYYCELIDWIHSYGVMVIPSKQTFSAFCGITVSMYNHLMNKFSDGDMVNVMNSIEDYIIEMTLSSAQVGSSNARTSITRTKIKGQGHSLREEKQEIEVINTTVLLTQAEVRKKLANLGSAKRIEKK